MGACSSAGRALQWHCRGQRFDPAQVHQNPHSFLFYNVLSDSALFKRVSFKKESVAQLLSVGANLTC
jgi:hypothetical protein